MSLDPHPPPPRLPANCYWNAEQSISQGHEQQLRYRLCRKTTILSCARSITASVLVMIEHKMWNCIEVMTALRAKLPIARPIMTRYEARRIWEEDGAAHMYMWQLRTLMSLIQFNLSVLQLHWQEDVWSVSCYKNNILKRCYYHTVIASLNYFAF